MDRQNRIYFRLNLKTPIYYSNSASTSEVPARGVSLDISAKGMGILSPSPMEKGGQCQLRFKLPGTWKTLSASAKVMNCFEKSDLPKPFRYRMGLEFQDLDENLSRTISDYILAKTSFLAQRWQVLLGGAFIFMALAGRSVLYELLGIFEGTLFGKEWLWSMPWNHFFTVAGILQLVVAFFWLAGCFGFFQFKRQGLWIVLGFSAGLTMFQGLRLAMKWNSFFSMREFGAWLFLFEGVSFLVLFSIFLLSLGVRPSLEAYLKAIQEYASNPQKV